MRLYSLLFNAVLLAGSGLAWRGPLPPRADPMSSSPAPLTPGGPPPPAGTLSVPAPLGSGGVGPKCGKGYTYCGYMLTSDGHNFAPNDISKAYCNGLSDLCTNGKPKTDVSEAVFVCMNEQPSSVELLCACSSKCRNDAESNFIAHCDKPCINGQ
ncbi:hypothetical protein F4819DRAFT_322708 [Hypoxylon fuscum]|nr:hypothetical protein F4819DRAFT_322708 [Hypoxylon fuscum]